MTWDELWSREIPEVAGLVDWLYEVKAAGDAFKERAEKLHSANEDLVSINKGLIAVRGEYLERVDTFKATEKRLAEVLEFLSENLGTDDFKKLKEKGEMFDKFLKEADKEVVFDIGAARYLDDQVNKIQRACRQMATIDVAHKADELARLPHRILQILGIPTCPACGLIADKAPCPHCGNDVGMEHGVS